MRIKRSISRWACKFVTTMVYSPFSRLLGTLVLNLWDCGGQESFMENYYRSQRENIFRNVEVSTGDITGVKTFKQPQYYRWNCFHLSIFPRYILPHSHDDPFQRFQKSKLFIFYFLFMQSDLKKILAIRVNISLSNIVSWFKRLVL